MVGPDNTYIFSGGRSERDYKTLIEAISGLNVRAVINTRPYILRSVSAPWIEINDLMPPDRYRQTLANAAIVILPLRNVQHAVGLSVILDSMAAGRPLICSELPVLREYVAHGETGFLVPPGNANAMRAAIRYLLDHPAEAEAMGKAARQRFEERYTFAAFARRAHNILLEVTKQVEQS
jgi:glycosyltransferase involved in cell wall biosynthesis